MFYYYTFLFFLDISSKIFFFLCVCVCVCVEPDPVGPPSGCRGGPHRRMSHSLHRALVMVPMTTERDPLRSFIDLAPAQRRRRANEHNPAKHSIYIKAGRWIHVVRCKYIYIYSSFLLCPPFFFFFFFLSYLPYYMIIFFSSLFFYFYFFFTLSPPLLRSISGDWYETPNAHMTSVCGGSWEHQRRGTRKRHSSFFGFVFPWWPYILAQRTSETLNGRVCVSSVSF